LILGIYLTFNAFMSDIIHLLPDNIANQIAAGEVVQRPASVVKELIENSIDSGANSIKLIVKDAGKALIQVIDNGCGMSETDARMSMERHATSKIKKVDDLFAIQTMGFRGEALPSVAAIAQVELKTKRVSDETGTKVVVEGSELKEHESCSYSNGTSVAVKNLFYNVPARRKFLKSNSVETRHIIDEFQRIAIAYPGINFSMHHNDTLVFDLAADNLKKRIIGVLGKQYNERLVPIEETTDILRIRGFVGKPEFSKKTRGEQFFFINKRFIRSAYLNHSVMTAFDDIIQKGHYPLYAIFIDLDPKLIDINVHPTKQEIKFQDERMIYAILQATVKRGLGLHSVKPSLDFEQERSFNISQPSFSRSGQSTATAEHKTKPVPKEWESLYKDLLETKEEKGGLAIQKTIEPTWNEKELPAKETQPYQVHQCYIITHIKSGLIIVDQNRAHERILYENYQQALSKKGIVSQQQLFPQTVELSVADYELVQDIMPEIRTLGFEIEDFGKNTLVVRGIPADVKTSGEQVVIESLLEQYKHFQSTLKLDKEDQVAISLARYAAIKSGESLSTDEMTGLIDQLFACQEPYQSPDGKLTLINLTLEDLKEQFD